MEKKNNSSKLAALAKLRSMVDELTNNDFKSNKMPKLMALKVTKVEPKMDMATDPMTKEDPMEEAKDLAMGLKEDSPEDMAHDAMEDSCPMCGGTGKHTVTEVKPLAEASKTVVSAAPADSKNVSKLKQLLGK